MSRGGNDADKSPQQKHSDNNYEDFGYDFYPDRGGKREKSLTSRLFEGRSAARAFRCVSNVYWCTRHSSAVKLLIDALHSKGCPVNLQRHVSCEDCFSRVNGGFDPIYKQVVVCQNNSLKKGVCCSVLGHELTHMFDYCRAKVDFKNLEHLACTEIRAANFFHCSFASAWTEGDTSLLNYSQKHQECVKRKATMSVLMVRNIPLKDAEAVVNKVFTKCYNDLEPFGRRPRQHTRDMDKALAEGSLYGYTR